MTRIGYVLITDKLNQQNKENINFMYIHVSS